LTANHEKDEVKIGQYYIADLYTREARVMITGHSSGGWDALNTVTGRRIRIKSARRLRRPAGRCFGDKQVQPECQLKFSN
jgi:hypothetical protein